MRHACIKAAIKVNKIQVNAIINHLLNDDRITDLDVITHSMSTAVYASKKFNVSIPGGALFKKMDSILGLEVEEFYRKINVDIAFLGSTGVHNCAGLTLSYPIQLMVKKASAECVDKRIAARALSVVGKALT